MSSESFTLFVNAYGALLQLLQTTLMRDLATTAMSSLDAVREAQGRQADTFAQQLDEVRRLNDLQARAAASARPTPNGPLETVHGDADASPRAERKTG